MVLLQSQGYRVEWVLCPRQPDFSHRESPKRFALALVATIDRNGANTAWLGKARAA